MAERMNQFLQRYFIASGTFKRFHQKTYSKTYTIMWYLRLSV